MKMGQVAAIEALLSGGPGAANGIVLDYLADMKGRASKTDKTKTLSTATRALRLAALRSMVKIARTTGKINWSLDVAADRVTPYRDTLGPSLDEFKQLIAEASKRTDAKGLRDLAMIRLYYNMGWRRGEVAALDLEHVDRSSSPWRLGIVGKGDEDRQWYEITPKTEEAVGAWLAVRGDLPGPLFPRLDPGAPPAGRGLLRLTGDAACQIVAGLARKAGIMRRVKPHSLRHSATTTLLDKTDGDYRAVQRFTRHVSIQTVQLYDDRRRERAGKLAELLDADG
jgi:integrase/recombinase XerC